MRPVIYAMETPDEAVGLATKKKEEEEVEGEESANFRREEADFKLFAARKLVSFVRQGLRKTGRRSRLCSCRKGIPGVYTAPGRKDACQSTTCP